MKRIAEYIAAVVFSVFFLFGGAGFTLSHYCCNACRSMQHTTYKAPSATDSLRFPASDKCNHTLSKHCKCCKTQHFAVDTTETTSAFCLPDKAEYDLFALCYPPCVHLTSTLFLPNEAGRVYPPPVAWLQDNTRGLLQRVCRWLV